MSIKPPKCKTCGKEEWRHICSGIGAARQRIKQINSRALEAKAKQRAKFGKRGQ